MKVFIDHLQKRGFLYQITNSLDELENFSSSNKIRGYIGFDCTAKSLHVGSLIQIMMLRWLQKFGHQPIILLGGGTTKVGDPSGRDEARKIICYRDIEKNKCSIKKIFSRFLSFQGSNKAIILDNDAWLKDLNYLEILRDFGSYFSINKMINLESVKSRLDRKQSLSFLEFNYMILQAFDFYYLHANMECSLQMGGSDQWGNIVSGIELIRKKTGHKVYGLTSPLLTTSSGSKMGKTVSGAIWLNEDLLSPYEYWQFWRNTEDSDVPKFLKLFTELPLDEIDYLSSLTGKEINRAKIILADEATKMCHGSNAALRAKNTSSDTFAANSIGEDLPKYTITLEKVNNKIPLFKLIVMGHLAQSNSNARRLIAGGAAKINNHVISDVNRLIQNSDFKKNILKISIGKKKHIIFQLESEA